MLHPACFCSSTRAAAAAKRRADGIPTFADAAERVWKGKNPGWRHPGHAQEWMSSLRRHVLPHIGHLPVCDVSSADLLDTLRRIWHVRPETARRVRQRVSAVMEWAVAMELRPDNPCDRIGGVLGPQQNLVQHMRALPHGEVAAAIQAMWGSGATPAVKLAFEFLVLTAARALGDGRSAFVFASQGGKPFSITRLPRLLQNLKIAAVPHGFRSSFRDWAAEETNHPREVVEAALAHVVGNRTEAAYARSDLFERRRRLMDEWADYLDGRGQVSPLLGVKPQPPDRTAATR